MISDSRLMMKGAEDLTLMWKEWKQEAANRGIVVLDDDSGLFDEEVYGFGQMIEGLQKCTCQWVSAARAIILKEKGSKSWKDWKALIVTKLGMHFAEDNTGWVPEDDIDPECAADAVDEDCILKEIEVHEQDSDINVDEWRAEYEHVRQNPPEPDDLILTEDGSPVKLEMEFQRGQAPLIFARLYVPTIVGRPLGWFARSMEDKSFYGWKAILSIKFRDIVIKKFGFANRQIAVKSIRILRQSQAGTAFVCEVEEWL